MTASPKKPALYDARMGLLLRTVTRLHRVLYRLTGGRLGRRFPGGAVVVWITSMGRKSGQWRKNPLLGAPDREVPNSWIIAGSNAGQEKVPAWVFNVRDRADGFIEIDGQSWSARFEELSGDEKDRCYALLTNVWSAFRSYRAVITREIPVFRVHLLQEVTETPVQ